MKKIRRTLSVILTFILLVTGMVSAFNVSAAPLTYKCELGMGKLQEGQFKFAAYNIAEGKFYDLEETAKPTWSPDWPGHFVPGLDVYTVSKSEEPEGLVDMMCDINNNWGSAVIFTAEKAGKYTVSSLMEKLAGENEQGCFYVDIKLIRSSDGAVLFQRDKHDIGEVELIKKGIELAAGDNLYILITPNAASTKTTAQNVALLYFTVAEEVVVTTPQSTTAPKETARPNDNGGDETQPTGNSSNGDVNGIDDTTLIILVSIIGDAVVLATLVIVIAVTAKKKKN